jgi:hypothetical protein
VLSVGVVEFAVAGLIEGRSRSNAILPAIVRAILDAILDDCGVRERKSVISPARIDSEGNLPFSSVSQQCWVWAAPEIDLSRIAYASEPPWTPIEIWHRPVLSLVVTPAWGSMPSGTLHWLPQRTVGKFISNDQYPNAIAPVMRSSPSRIL